MKTSERLIERLRADGQPLPPCTELRRIGRNTRTRIGRWSWFAYCPLAGTDPEHSRHLDLRIGSHWSVAELLAAPRLIYSRGASCGDICVDPWTGRELAPLEHIGDSANLAFYAPRGRPPGYIWAEVCRDDYRRTVPAFSVSVRADGTGEIARFTYEPRTRPAGGPLPARTVTRLIRARLEVS